MKFSVDFFLVFLQNLGVFASFVNFQSRSDLFGSARIGADADVFRASVNALISEQTLESNTCNPRESEDRRGRGRPRMRWATVTELPSRFLRKYMS